MRLLLAIPPLTQFNTPYPSVAYLTSYLTKKGHDVNQVDLSLELILKIFSSQGIREISQVVKKKKKRNQLLDFFLDASSEYERTIDEVIKFLQIHESNQLKKIAKREYLPEGPRFLPLDENHGGLQDLFNDLSEVDQAKHIASLYLDDLADVIREGVDEDFGFSRYAEKISLSLTSFSPLLKRLKKRTLLDEWISELTISALKKYSPQVLGLSVPFPGNLLGALRIAQTAKINFPSIKIIMGGGYVNTELRELSDPRVFDLIDFLTFDDGEIPLELLLSSLQNGEGELLRTMFRSEGKVVMRSNPALQDVRFKNLDAPSYKDLQMNRYISMMEAINPMQRLWTDGRWNKMILAHGCYWKKCTFCDVSLDYIGRFDPDSAAGVVDKMVKVMRETGVSSFHFVDEAAPPSLLKSMSQEIIKRKLNVRWWGNLRFDPFFTPEVTKLMQQAGCMAVTGGIEVASERVLKLINKGIDLDQVTKVTKNFKDAGIFVHAYLMYGFPTQTVQETIDSLEVVRRLFKNKNLSSAYWHRFALTVHSPVGKNPEKFKIKIHPPKVPQEGLFALNEVSYSEEHFVDHDMLGSGLRRALYNYMLGLGLDMDVREWFDIKVPKPKVLIT
jgi:radical SAM superfamily enzyme YgiQ (UPF0313 family)